MKAIRVQEFGDPSVLKLVDVPDLSAGPGQVVVRVKAIGVNPVDTLIRSGGYGTAFPVPYVPGSDAAGLIEAIGDGVSSFAVGDRVYTSGTKSGAYAELALCDIGTVHPLPQSTSFAQGAALGVPYATAHYALRWRANAQQGETVLIHGATGGVGIAAVQIARDRGMTVIATGGTEAGRRLLAEQGVEYVFDHRAPDYRQEILGVNCGRGPDVILEMLANINLAHDLRMVAKSGRVVVIGSRGEVTINPRDLMSKQSTVLGMMLFAAKADELKLTHDYLIQGLEKGVLRPVIREEIPLGDAPLAHQKVSDKNGDGKIVLVP